MFGLVYQPRIESWLEQGVVGVDCIEVQAEHFYDATPHHIRWLSARTALVVRCSSLSLGGAEPLDDRQVDSCTNVVRDANPVWLTHPLGFSRVREVDLGVSIPIPLTASSLDRVSDRASQVIERCGRRLLVENGAARLRIAGTIAETEFLGRLCDRAGTGLLIDVGALCMASRLHRFDPVAWLADIDSHHIVQLRLGVPGPQDANGEPPPAFSEQLALVRHALERARPLAFTLAVSSCVHLPAINRALSTLRVMVEDCVGRNWAAGT